MRLAIGFAVVLAMTAGALLADAPKVGDKAPEFKLKASDGKEYSLSQFAGKNRS